MQPDVPPTTRPERLPPSLPIHPLMARPLMGITLAFAGGVLVGGVPGLPWIWTVLAAAGTIVAGAIRRDFWRMTALLLGFMAAGAWRQAMAITPAPADVSRWIGAGYVTVRGTAAGDVYSHAYSHSCLLRVERIALSDSSVVEAQGYVTARLWRRQNAPPPTYGDALEITGRLEPLRDSRNPGGFSPNAYFRHHGIFASLVSQRASGWRTLPRPPAPGDWLNRLAARCRASFQATMKRLLPPAEAGLLTGIALGVETDIPAPIQEDFIATGTAHILAASGMNVALLAILFGLCCRLLRLSRRTSALLTLVVLGFYTLVAGAKPSIVRADLMASLYLLADLLDREGDAPNALAAAALCLLAYDPGNLFDAGFQLSFAIVASALAAMPLWESILQRRLPDARLAAPWSGVRLLAAAVGGVGLTLIAQIAAMPLTAQHFNMVSPVGLAANALIAPPIALLMGGGFIAWAFGLLWIPGAQVLCTLLLHPLLAYLIGAADACAQIPFASLNVASPGWLLIALYYALFAMIVRYLRARRLTRE